MGETRSRDQLIDRGEVTHGRVVGEKRSPARSGHAGPGPDRCHDVGLQLVGEVQHPLSTGAACRLPTAHFDPSMAKPSAFFVALRQECEHPAQLGIGSMSSWVRRHQATPPRICLLYTSHAKEQRRSQLEDGLAQILDVGFQGRILNFDEKAANAAALISAKQRSMGHSNEIRDAFIAGIVISQNADLATRNVRHFRDLSLRVINPWSI